MDAPYPPTPSERRGATAVFIDIENLVGSAGATTEAINRLSLDTIMSRLNSFEAVHTVAIKRAYANWSDARLTPLRNELFRLGIDPVQVFGFNRRDKKHLADIELTVDVIDTMHTKPNIDVFALISGEAAYASVVKKLHEYGKFIIGSALETDQNQVMSSVCDEFLWLESPQEDKYDSTVLRLSDPNVELVRAEIMQLNSRLKPTLARNAGEAAERVKEVFELLERNSISNAILRQGVHLPIIRELLGSAIRDFDYKRYGFGKFTNFLQYASRDSRFAVYHAPPTDTRLGLRGTPIDGFELLKDIEENELVSVDNYRAILASGFPIIRPPAPDRMRVVASCLTEIGANDLPLGEIIDRVAYAYSDDVSFEEVKHACLALVSVGVFDRYPEGPGVKLANQRLTLPTSLNMEDLVHRLWTRSYLKIKDATAEVDEQVLQDLVPKPIGDYGE